MDRFVINLMLFFFFNSIQPKIKTDYTRRLKKTKLLSDKIDGIENKYFLNP